MTTITTEDNPVCNWLRPIPGEHEVESFDRTIDQPAPETVS